MTARRYRCSWGSGPYINVSDMKSDGTLEPGDHMLVFDCDAILRDIVITIGPDRRELTAIYRWNDSNNVTRVSVALDWRPCRFGGLRAYFICPGCQRCTVNLAVWASGLRCGPCANVTYQKRWDTDLTRRVKAANEVSAKLGCSTWIDKPERPKGMHRRTFERLLCERDRRIAKILGTPFGARAIQRMQRQGIQL